MDENCTQCRFSRTFDREDNTRIDRFCQRYPPALLPDVSGGGNSDGIDIETTPSTTFPLVEDDDWCGEFQLKASTK